MDLRFGLVPLNVFRVLTVVLELSRLSFVIWRPMAVEFVERMTFLAPPSCERCLSGLDVALMVS